MEKSQVTHVSQYASWQEQPMVELPTDEINVEKAEEVTKAIEESGITFDETPMFSPELLQSKTIVQQSMATLKELTNNPEVQKALEAEGLTVDFSKVNQTWNDGTGFGVGLETGATIRPLTDEEAEAVTSGGTCACTDCVESTDTNVDTDTMLIVHDLSERLAALEARIAAFNVKASHKI